MHQQLGRPEIGWRELEGVGPERLYRVLFKGSHVAATLPASLLEVGDAQGVVGVVGGVVEDGAHLADEGTSLAAGFEVRHLFGGWSLYRQAEVVSLAEAAARPTSLN